MISLNDFAPIATLDLEPIKLKLMDQEEGKGWSLAQATAVEFEYRRFLYLMKMFPTEATAPLVDVDTFWHYHILDTMKYAVDCEKVFGYFLHHYPALRTGGSEQQEVVVRMGERMREVYEQTFGDAYDRPVADTGRGLRNAYCSRVDTKAAYCSRVATKAAYCSRVDTKAAYCSRVEAKTAYCSRIETQTAYCSRVDTKPAYCSRVDTKTAYCSRVDTKTAYCSRVDTKTAYCSRIDTTKASGTAFAANAKRALSDEKPPLPLSGLGVGWDSHGIGSL